MIIEAVGFDNFRVGCFELTADARSKALEEILHETIVSLICLPGRERGTSMYAVMKGSFALYSKTYDETYDY